MFTRRALDAQRDFISCTARELVPEVGDRIEWVSPLLGRFILVNLDIPKSKIFKPPYYELRAGLKIDVATNRIPMELYMFHKGGNILGVINNFAENYVIDETIAEFRSSTDFQIDNGLIAPNKLDYDKLEDYLRNGQMDKI